MSQKTRQELLQKIKELEYENNMLKQMKKVGNSGENYMQEILNNIPASIFLKDTQGNYLMINKRYGELIHVVPADIVGKNDCDILPQAVAALFRSQDQEVIIKNAAIEFEETIPLPDGIHSFITAKFPLHGKDGAISGVGGFCTNITERKETEEQIKASLNEKELLLRELHHRVKNNMQVIISLLRLQAEKIKDEGYADMLRESQERIRSMSLIHEQLYQSKDFTNIDFKGYVEKLLKILFRSHGANIKRIKLTTEIDNITLDLENATPCGLIINELVSNSLKYAFPGEREGNIRIAIKAIGRKDLELVVGDDGVGLPKELDIRNADTLGLHLVAMLAERQLDGEVELNRMAGTEFRIRFQKQEYKLRI